MGMSNTHIISEKLTGYINFVNGLTSKFPQHEMCGLTSQFRRAACSASLNFHEQMGTPAAVNFAAKAFAGLKECTVCAMMAEEKGYITAADRFISATMLLELRNMLSGLTSSSPLK
jgi:four helix bundle protein